MSVVTEELDRLIAEIAPSEEELRALLPSEEELTATIWRLLEEMAGGVLSARTLNEAMERLRKNYYPLWLVMVEVHGDPSLPERWREAPEGSTEWRKSVQHEDALEVLRVSTSE